MITVFRLVRLVEAGDPDLVGADVRDDDVVGAERLAEVGDRPLGGDRESAAVAAASPGELLEKGRPEVGMDQRLARPRAAPRRRGR